MNKMKGLKPLLVSGGMGAACGKVSATRPLIIKKDRTDVYKQPQYKLNAKGPRKMAGEFQIEPETRKRLHT